MYIKKNLIINLFLMTSFVWIMAIIILPTNCNAEISVDSYCQLTIKTMQQKIPQTQELTSIVNQYKNDPETLNQQLEIKRTEFDKAVDVLYSSYGTTDQEFVTYMNRNKKAVNAYLEENPDIKQQIDNLSAQLNALVEEEDALR